MIYSKTTNNFHEIGLLNLSNLENCKFEDTDIFLHHRNNNMKIYDCFESEHWDHIRNNSNVKLLHINTTETMGYGLSLSLDQVIRTHKINPNQIYVIVYDQLHKIFLENELKKLDITSINIGVFNSSFARTFNYNINISPTTKFSILSRNFKLWRLKLYVNLVKNDLLSDFNYSFYNVNPYNNFVYDLNSIMSELDNNKITVSNAELDWLNKIPYILDIEKNDEISGLNNKVWTDESYQAIKSSDIHLIVETFFEYKPSINFRSEKTYKALSCSKPFLVYSTKGFLDDLRTAGYKTFSPYIDETYDTIDDNDERLEALVNEVIRIKNLREVDYANLLLNCNRIANENFEIFKEQKSFCVDENNFNSSFNFLKPYLTNYEGWDFPIVIL